MHKRHVHTTYMHRSPDLHAHLLRVASTLLIKHTVNAAVQNCELCKHTHAHMHTCTHAHTHTCTGLLTCMPTSSVWPPPC